MSEAYAPKWKNRRKVIWGTLAYCGVALGWIIVKDSGSGLHETLGQGLLALMGWCVMFYVGGVVVEEVKAMGLSGIKRAG